MLESEGQDSKTRWSYSRAACFAHCKYEFYLNYVVNDDDLYLSEGNYYAEVGSFVHEILAKVLSGDLPEDEALGYFLDHYDEYVVYETRRSTMDKTYEAVADYFAALDLSWLSDYEILGVEQEQEFMVGDRKFIGYIDLLLRDKRDGKIVVVDHKSTEYPFKKGGGVKKKLEKSFSSYRRQMYLYCHAIKEKYGEFPKEITWNHFKEGGRFATIPFVIEEYEETLKWFDETATDAESEKLYEPSEEFFYCWNLCNFRNSCEYRNERDSYE